MAVGSSKNNINSHRRVILWGWEREGEVLKALDKGFEGVLHNYWERMLCEVES